MGSRSRALSGRQSPCPVPAEGHPCRDPTALGLISLPAGTCMRAGAQAGGGSSHPSRLCSLLAGEVGSPQLKLGSGILCAPHIRPFFRPAWGRLLSAGQSWKESGCQLAPSPGFTGSDLLTPSPGPGPKAPALGLALWPTIDKQ